MIKRYRLESESSANFADAAVKVLNLIEEELDLSELGITEPDEEEDSIVLLYDEAVKLKRNNDNLLERIGQTREMLSSRVKDLKSLNDEVTRLKKEKEDLKQELSSSKSREDDSQTIINNLRAECNGLKQQLMSPVKMSREELYQALCSIGLVTPEMKRSTSPKDIEIRIACNGRVSHVKLRRINSNEWQGQRIQ